MYVVRYVSVCGMCLFDPCIVLCLGITQLIRVFQVCLCVLTCLSSFSVCLPTYMAIYTSVYLSACILHLKILVCLYFFVTFCLMSISTCVFHLCMSLFVYPPPPITPVLGCVQLSIPWSVTLPVCLVFCTSISSCLPLWL